MDRDIIEMIKNLDYFSMLRIVNIFKEIGNLSDEELKFFSSIINVNLKNLSAERNIKYD